MIVSVTSARRKDFVPPHDHLKGRKPEPVSDNLSQAVDWIITREHALA